MAFLFEPEMICAKSLTTRVVPMVRFRSVRVMMNWGNTHERVDFLAQLIGMKHYMHRKTRKGK